MSLLDVSLGEELPPLRKTITLERSQRYGGPARGLHADPAAAQAEGFPNVVTWGMLTVTYFSELLGDAFRIGWTSGGKLRIKLIKPVFAEDVLTIHARLTGVAPEGEVRRLTFDLWADSQRGETVAAGEASGLVKP